MPYDPVPQSDHHHQASENQNRLPNPPRFNHPSQSDSRYHLHPNQLSPNLSPSADQISHRSSSDCFSSADEDLPIPQTINSSSPSSSISSSSSSVAPSPTANQIPSVHLPTLNQPSISSASSSSRQHSQNIIQSQSHQSLSNQRRVSNKLRDSYADTYGAPASASGPDISSLSAIASGLVGGDYGPFPQELTMAGMNSTGGYGISNLQTHKSSSSPPQTAALSAVTDGGLANGTHRLSAQNLSNAQARTSAESNSQQQQQNHVGRPTPTNESQYASNRQVGGVGSQKVPGAESNEFAYPSADRRLTNHSSLAPFQTFNSAKSRRPTSQDGYSASFRDSLVSYDDGSGGYYFHGPSNGFAQTSGLGYIGAYSETTEDLLWKDENKEPDDFLHDPDPELDSRADKRFILWSKRGWLNVISLGILVGGLVSLFALYPIITYVFKHAPGTIGWNLGGINGTGQVPDIPGLPGLIDATTPDDAKSRTGIDGKKYNLVFSDEFNTDGRTFWPGDDPFWEAVDLHYWQTTNFEWYDPDAVTTKGGNLVITLNQENIHNLNVSSGMIQSWNKFCFTEGYIEVNISLPGKPGVQGLWPGVWTMGNLARAGFGASNEGMWPYSYEVCDVGTLPNQTMPDGITPPAAKTSGSKDYGGELSWLPGQRTSACTCKGEDHPGPSVSVGRSGPEIDVLEAQYAYGPNGNLGSMSQSIQVAPMDEGYFWANDSSSMHVVKTAQSSRDSSGTIINAWHGSIWQESLSGITMTDGVSYEGASFQRFGFEYVKGYQADGGRVTWTYNGEETWSIYANSLAQQSGTQISPRPITTEPMYVILNLGISNKFQTVEWEKLTFPAKMYIDYVRIYQREGKTNIGCSPKDRPTEDYIKRHIGAYTNPNFTTWAEAGFTKPKNRLKDQC